MSDTRLIKKGNREVDLDNYILNLDSNFENWLKATGFSNKKLQELRDTYSVIVLKIDNGTFTPLIGNKFRDSEGKLTNDVENNRIIVGYLNTIYDKMPLYKAPEPKPKKGEIIYNPDNISNIQKYLMGNDLNNFVFLDTNSDNVVTGTTNRANYMLNRLASLNPTVNDEDKESWEHLQTTLRRILQGGVDRNEFIELSQLGFTDLPNWFSMGPEPTPITSELQLELEALNRQIAVINHMSLNYPMPSLDDLNYIYDFSNSKPFGNYYNEFFNQEFSKLSGEEISFMLQYQTYHPDMKYSNYPFFVNNDTGYYKYNLQVITMMNTYPKAITLKLLEALVQKDPNSIIKIGNNKFLLEHTYDLKNGTVIQFDGNTNTLSPVNAYDFNYFKNKMVEDSIAQVTGEPNDKYSNIFGTYLASKVQSLKKGGILKFKGGGANLMFLIEDEKDDLGDIAHWNYFGNKLWDLDLVFVKGSDDLHGNTLIDFGGKKMSDSGLKYKTNTYDYNDSDYQEDLKLFVTNYLNTNSDAKLSEALNKWNELTQTVLNTRRNMTVDLWKHMATGWKPFADAWRLLHLYSTQKGHSLADLAIDNGTFDSETLSKTVARDDLQGSSMSLRLGTYMYDPSKIQESIDWSFVDTSRNDLTNHTFSLNQSGQWDWYQEKKDIENPCIDPSVCPDEFEDDPDNPGKKKHKTTNKIYESKNGVWTEVTPQNIPDAETMKADVENPKHWWSTLIPDSGQIANAKAIADVNDKNLKLLLQKRSPFKDVPNWHLPITGEFGLVQDAERLAANIEYQGLKPITSDVDKQAGYARQSILDANKLRSTAYLHEDLHIDQERLKANALDEKYMLKRHEVADYDKAAAIANENEKLEARASNNLKKVQNWTNLSKFFIDRMYKDIEDKNDKYESIHSQVLNITLKYNYQQKLDAAKEKWKLANPDKSDSDWLSSNEYSRASQDAMNELYMETFKNNPYGINVTFKKGFKPKIK